MSDLTIGIDPGLTGAIAAVDGEQLMWCVDMPIANGAIAIALLDRLYRHDEYGPWQLRTKHLATGITMPEPIAVEHVHSMPKQGVASTFKFGKAYGTVLGYFAANGHRITHVAPTEWKGTFRLNGKDKDAARALAIELWPGQAQLFARKKDGGRADAALIALHHARTSYHNRVQALRDERAALDGAA